MKFYKENRIFIYTEKNMTKTRNDKNISILLISPEIYGLPSSMGHLSNIIKRPSGGGMGDMNHLLIRGLWDLGIDAHYMGPNFKGIYQKIAMGGQFKNSDEYIDFIYKEKNKNIHLLNAKQFDQRSSIYQHAEDTNRVFQDIARTGHLRDFFRDRDRKVIVIGTDQYTGALAAYFKARKIPFVSWAHNVMTHLIHQDKYQYFNFDEESIRKNIFWNKYEYSGIIDTHATAIKNAARIIPVSKQFEKELREGKLIGQMGLEESRATLEEIMIRQDKLHAIPNALPESALPENQDFLYKKFTHKSNIVEAKRINKLGFQKDSQGGLDQGDDYILIGWTSRMDESQKGISGVIDNLEFLMSNFNNVQVAFVGDDVTENKEFYNKLKPYIEKYKGRIHHEKFSKNRSNQLYAASDIIVGNSKREPFGLFTLQAILSGAIVGSPAVGGSVDIVDEIDLEKGVGNGVLSQNADSGGVNYFLKKTIGVIQEAYKDKDKWNSHLQRMVYDIKDKFSEEVYLKQVVEMLDSVALEFNLYKGGYKL